MSCVTLRRSAAIMSLQVAESALQYGQWEKWGQTSHYSSARAVHAATEGRFGFGILFIQKLKEILFL
jgi:hypothetical protein